MSRNRSYWISRWLYYAVLYLPPILLGRKISPCNKQAHLLNEGHPDGSMASPLLVGMLLCARLLVCLLLKFIQKHQNTQ